jgi:hypothetical protein
MIGTDRFHLQKGLIKKGDMKKGVNWIENAENGGHHN